MIQSYSIAYPDLAIEFKRRMSGELPCGWKDNLPSFPIIESKVVATRNRSEEILNHLAFKFPEIFGGSADLVSFQ